MLKTHPEQVESLIRRLERIVQPDVYDAGAVAAAELVERLAEPIWTGSGSAGRFRGREITNLLQDALEEQTTDQKLPPMVVALGLLLASLDSPPRK